MYSIHKASHRIGNIGDPLPAPFEVFGRKNVKITFRRGGVSMLAGIPGSYKTAVALNAVVHWTCRDVYTQYFSVDSDESTVKQRLCGIVSGDDMDEVEYKLQFDPYHYDEKLYDVLGDKVMFEYQNMGFESMVHHVASYDQKFGGYPDLIVIDNLIDLASGVYAFDEMQAIIKAADGLAKKTKSHVMILHHARLVTPDSGMENTAGMPPPDNQIQGRMTQFPTLVLTLGAAGNLINVSAVKNRFGFQYPDASRRHAFTVQDNMRVSYTSSS